MGVGVCVKVGVGDTYSVGVNVGSGVIVGVGVKVMVGVLVAVGVLARLRAVIPALMRRMPKVSKIISKALKTKIANVATA